MMNSPVVRWGQRQITDVLPRRGWPSWLISLGLHVLVLVVLFGTRTRLGTPDGNPEGFHDVGIYVKPDAELVEPAPENQEANATPQEATPENSAMREATASPPDETPPAPLQLPETATIGVGSPFPDQVQGAPLTVPGTPTKGTTGGPLSKPLPGRSGRGDGTSFLGIPAQGNTFLYLIDSSSSMADHNAIGYARAELMASLERLDSTKRFQILFYNSQMYPLIHPDGRQRIFFATDLSRNLARQFMHDREPAQGTNHKPAILEALKFGPDVLFFLTDGDQPALFAGDLDEIKRNNRGHTQIHVIEFGKGVKLGPTNWLEQLARSNRGSYRYFDLLTK